MKRRYLIPILLVILIVGGMLGASCSKPDIYERALDELAEDEARLGEMNKLGEFYTLREFSYDIARLTEPLPDDWVTEEMGFSKLVVFYKRSEMLWKEYDTLPLDMESTIALISESLYGSDDYSLAEILWHQYEELPSKPTGVRTKYRSNHPELEATLIFWAKVSKSVFYIGTKEWEEVSKLDLAWFNDYKIDARMHPKWANWTLLKTE